MRMKIRRPAFVVQRGKIRFLERRPKKMYKQVMDDATGEPKYVPLDTPSRVVTGYYATDCTRNWVPEAARRRSRGIEMLGPVYPDDFPGTPEYALAHA